MIGQKVMDNVAKNGNKQKLHTKNKVANDRISEQ